MYIATTRVARPSVDRQTSAQKPSGAPIIFRRCLRLPAPRVAAFARWKSASISASHSASLLWTSSAGTFRSLRCCLLPPVLGQEIDDFRPHLHAALVAVAIGIADDGRIGPQLVGAAEHDARDPPHDFAYECDDGVDPLDR